MSTAVQTSLFDLADQPAKGDFALGPLGGMVTRQVLGRGAWVDLLPGWLSGAGSLFDDLQSQVPWRAERRRMYERVVDVPRMLCFYGDNDPLPHPDLVTAREYLNAPYRAELGEPFTSAGLCLYRDGTDSVAWHGDTVGRSSTQDTMVAIVSLGARRTFAMRPRTGGRSLRLPQGHGDLLVMGGSCQRTWEHAVPKTARPTGPRISIQFRARDVR